MDVDVREMRHDRSVDKDQDESPVRERGKAGYNDMEEDDIEKSRESSKQRSKDRSKSSGRRDEKDYRSKDRERSRVSEGTKEREKESSKEPWKDDRDERGKDKSRDKLREKDADRDKYKDKERDKDRKERGKDKEREREKERTMDKDTERVRDRERGKEKSKEKEREKLRDKEKERELDRDRGRDAVERDKGKERAKVKELGADQNKERLSDRDRGSRRHRDENHERVKDEKSRLRNEDADDNDVAQTRKGSHDNADNTENHKLEHGGSKSAPSELEERILRMKEERLQKKPEGASEVLAWVSKSRKLEDKRNAEKEKALQLSKIFEEQDNMKEDESDDERPSQHADQNLGGVKILHGIDKVLEGGAVVLTLKDQNILANGDVNEEVDMLENIEIGEQKRRSEAYNAAKRKTEIYYDKYNDEPGVEKKLLPQYDEPTSDEGITLDASGRFAGDAEKKLDELRKRLQGGSTTNHIENLNSSGKMYSDYYTQEEMLQFKKPKKKKSLRKKEKLDIEALEAEAKSSGLGAGDLGSRKDGKRQTLREEQEKSQAQIRSNAYQAAYAKAEEASKALRTDQTPAVNREEDETPVLGDDDEDLRKSLERARKLALKKQEDAVASVPQVIARLASSAATDSNANNQNTSTSGESQDNKVVFTEMEEFVWGLQLNEEAQKPDDEDVFMEEDEVPNASDQGKQLDDGGWAEVEETKEEEAPAIEREEDIVPDETIHESAVGKGLAGALKILKDRGTLKETVEWGGRNMDKKKSKLVGIHDNEGKEINIERLDEYGRILTPKEAFRLISHKFHGKGPGKMKQEKRMRQYQEELKVKQMKNSDTPSQSVERMREVQAQLKTPYLVLSGHVKPGQTSDPRSGFATVEKDFPGGLTPMLGDKKVEHFLGLKRKSESGDPASSQKKPKT